MAKMFQSALPNVAPADPELTVITASQAVGPRAASGPGQARSSRRHWLRSAQKRVEPSRLREGCAKGLGLEGIAEERRREVAAELEPGQETAVGVGGSEVQPGQGTSMEVPLSCTLPGPLTASLCWEGRTPATAGDRGQDFTAL